MGVDPVDPLRAWQDVYTLLGTAAATLFGLLFIAVSLHLGQVVGPKSRTGVRGVAGFTFTNFVYLVVLCVLLLLPGLKVAELGWTLAGFAVLGVSFEAIAWRRAEQDADVRTGQFLLLPLIGQLLMFGCAVALLARPTPVALVWLAIAVIVLLVGAVHNTWELLVSLSE